MNELPLTSAAEPKVHRLDPLTGSGVAVARTRGENAQPRPLVGCDRPRARWRRGLIVLLLLALPVVVYWPTIFYRYGFRDDYAILRESHEEVGKVFRVCAMQARPIYGLVMQPAFSMLRGIDDLPWVRLGSALLIGALAGGFFLLLSRLKWEIGTAALLAATLTVLPPAQISISWAVAMPLCLALLVALGAFACADRAFAIERPIARAAWWTAAVLLVTASALIYQPNSLFYFTAVAAALWSRRHWESRRAAEWLVRHGATAGIGLGLAFTIMMTAFAHGWVPVSHRVALEQDWLGKLRWFFGEPLEHALGLIVIDDNEGSLFAYAAAALVVLVLTAGMLREGRLRGWRKTAGWGVALAGLGVASFCVNLVVADRWPAYRVLLPLTGVVAVGFTMALFILGGHRAARIGLLALLVPGVWLARRQTLDLIAWPQSVELALIEAGAARIDLARHPRVFVITPVPAQHVASRVVADEFGSLSTDSDWVPKEMLKQVLRARYPELHDVDRRFTYASGRKPPPPGGYDVIIDLRHLRDFRPLGTRG